MLRQQARGLGKRQKFRNKGGTGVTAQSKLRSEGHSILPILLTPSRRAALRIVRVEVEQRSEVKSLRQRGQIGVTYTTTPRFVGQRPPPTTSSALRKPKQRYSVIYATRMTLMGMLWKPRGKGIALIKGPNIEGKFASPCLHSSSKHAGTRLDNGSQTFYRLCHARAAS